MQPLQKHRAAEGSLPNRTREMLGAFSRGSDTRLHRRDMLELRAKWRTKIPHPPRPSVERLVALLAHWAGAAAGPPWGRRVTVVVPRSRRCGCGRVPRAVAGLRSPGRPGCQRPGRPRPGPGRRCRSSGRGRGTAHECGLPGCRLVGANWCGTGRADRRSPAVLAASGGPATMTTTDEVGTALTLQRACSSSRWRRRSTPHAPVVRRHRQWRQTAGRSSSRAAVNTPGPHPARGAHLQCRPAAARVGLRHRQRTHGLNAIRRRLNRRFVADTVQSG